MSSLINQSTEKLTGVDFVDINLNQLPKNGFWTKKVFCVLDQEAFNTCLTFKSICLIGFHLQRCNIKVLQGSVWSH